MTKRLFVLTMVVAELKKEWRHVILLFILLASTYSLFTIVLTNLNFYVNYQEIPYQFLGNEMIITFENSKLSQRDYEILRTKYGENFYLIIEEYIPLEKRTIDVYISSRDLIKIIPEYTNQIDNTLNEYDTPTLNIKIKKYWDYVEHASQKIRHLMVVDKERFLKNRQELFTILDNLIIYEEQDVSIFISKAQSHQLKVLIIVICFSLFLFTLGIVNIFISAIQYVYSSIYTYGIKKCFGIDDKLIFNEMFFKLGALNLGAIVVSLLNYKPLTNILKLKSYLLWSDYIVGILIFIGILLTVIGSCFYTKFLNRYSIARLLKFL